MTPELSIRIRSAAPAAMITVSLRPAVPATDPMIVLLLPVVRDKPAEYPRAKLFVPVFRYNAFRPNAELKYDEIFA